MIPFIKAHACGNDFLIVQEQYAGDRGHDELVRSLCNRNQGIGADGVEFFAAEEARKGTIHLYNADGSMAEISGNGTRCVAAWMAYETKAAPGDDLYLKTDAGPRACRVVSREGASFLIASSMGVPEIQRRAVVVGGERVEGVVVLPATRTSSSLWIRLTSRYVAARGRALGKRFRRMRIFPTRRMSNLCGA